MWSKKDSENLASIEKSLRMLAEREQERALVPQASEGFFDFFKRKRAEATKEIDVYEPKNLEEIAEEELMESRSKIAAKVNQAKAKGKDPFFIEDMLSAEELENL